MISHGIRTLGVLGAGQMGLGIAFVSALRAKVPVLLHDRSQEQVTKGLAFADKLLEKDVSKGRITSEEAKEAKDRITPVNDIKGFRDVDMVVEVRSCRKSGASVAYSNRRCQRNSPSRDLYLLRLPRNCLRVPSWRQTRALLVSPRLQQRPFPRVSAPPAKRARRVLDVSLVSSVYASMTLNINHLQGLHFFNPVPVMVCRVSSATF